MLPAHAEDTVKSVMELTAGQLDHVVTHSAVRWWGANRDGDETNTLKYGVRGSLVCELCRIYFNKAYYKTSRNSPS